MPAACPIERSDTGTHGHSRDERHDDDLHMRRSGGVQSQPSKLVMPPIQPGPRAGPTVALGCAGEPG